MRGKCDACGREGELHVRASALGPISLAYCEECLVHGAEGKDLLHTTIACVGGIDQLANWCLDGLFVYHGWKYVSAREYVEQNRDQIEQAQREMDAMCQAHDEEMARREAAGEPMDTIGFLEEVVGGEDPVEDASGQQFFKRLGRVHKSVMGKMSVAEFEEAQVAGKALLAEQAAKMTDPECIGSDFHVIGAGSLGCGSLGLRPRLLYKKETGPTAERPANDYRPTRVYERELRYVGTATNVLGESFVRTVTLEPVISNPEAIGTGLKPGTKLGKLTVEGRLEVSFLNDEQLRKAMEEGREEFQDRLWKSMERHADLHTRTAAEFFGKKDEEVTADERSYGKMINYWIAYDMPFKTYREWLNEREK